MIPVGTNLRLKHFPWATIGLLGANWVIFIFHQEMDHEIDFWIWHHFYNIPGELTPYALITSMFFHADIWHIGFNSLYLWVFGIFVEDKLGWKAYLYLYLLTGMVSGLIHSTMVGLFLREEIFIPGLGASGAISGIMGIYLYRCYYSKIKLLISIWLPIRIQVPAIIILSFWFVINFMGGIDSIRGISTNIAFWAHVGGFLAGLGACKYLHYGKAARSEKLEFVAETALPQFEGYGEGVEAAKKLLQENPDHPEINLELARTLSRWRASEEGKDRYVKAINLFLKTDPDKAIEIFTEYWGKYFTLFNPPQQVRLSLLLEKRNPDFAAITLQSLIDTDSSDCSSMEEAYLQLARIYRQRLGRNDLARAVYEKFLQKFPKSEKREYIQKVLEGMEKISK